jgi:ABC-2 type transport system ATP-binding protein
MQLTIENVGKQYRRDFWGLRDFGLTLEPGVLGLLGPNGAGKSTLMRILATITKPTTGQVTWNGANIARSPNELRQVLGYLPQDFGVYPHLDAIEALLNDPQLLIVDEPTAGLDPEERVRFRNLLSDLSGNRIVILSTHIVSDVEATATYIALISQGHLIKHAPPEELLKHIEGKVWEWTVSSEELTALKQQYLVSGTIRKSDGVMVRAVSATRPTPQAQSVTPRLEDAYLDYIAGDRKDGTR